MREEKVAKQFQEGIDCSQVVLAHFAEEHGMNIEEAQKIAAFFGGGMGEGETCGAVVGGMLAMGLQHGHTETTIEQKDKMMEKRAQFFEEFNKKYDSSRCSCLLGHDISDPEEFQKILDEGLLFNFCPKLVVDVIDIVENLKD